MSVILGPRFPNIIRSKRCIVKYLLFSNKLGCGRRFPISAVQAFQHIRDFALACRNASRVLKPGGKFINCSLHAPLFLRALYRLCGTPFHTEGDVPERFYLCRAGDRQIRIVEESFCKSVCERFTECLCHPDLRVTPSRKADSWLGPLDAKPGASSCMGRLMAGQRNLCVVK